MTGSAFITWFIPAGASSISKDDLTHQETRLCIDSICEWIKSMRKRGINKEILTVDNHCDGPYLYLKTKRPALKSAGDPTALEP